MAQSIFRASPLFLNGQLVAEISQNTEDRTLNVSQQYGIEGVIGQAIGADEIKVSFDTVTPIQGMQIPIDTLLGVPVQIQVVRNGVSMLSSGIIGSSSYASNSKDGTATGKFEFMGAAPQFVA